MCGHASSVYRRTPGCGCRSGLWREYAQGVRRVDTIVCCDHGAGAHADPFHAVPITLPGGTSRDHVPCDSARGAVPGLLADRRTSSTGSPLYPHGGAVTRWCSGDDGGVVPKYDDVEDLAPARWAEPRRGPALRGSGPRRSADGRDNDNYFIDTDLVGSARMGVGRGHALPPLDPGRCQARVQHVLPSVP